MTRYAWNRVLIRYDFGHRHVDGDVSVVYTWLRIDQNYSTESYPVLLNDEDQVLIKGLHIGRSLLCSIAFNMTY